MLTNHHKVGDTRLYLLQTIVAELLNAYFMHKLGLQNFAGVCTHIYNTLSSGL